MGNKRSVAGRIGSALVIFLIILFSLAPLVWMVSTSFKTTMEQTAIPPTLIPKNPTIKPYIDGWISKAFGQIFYNTFMVSILTTIVCIILASLAGYGFSKYRIKGSNTILTIIFVIQMFPTTVIIIPYFMMMNSLGLLNSYAALVISYTSFSLPLCIWILKSFFDDLPTELDEAARLDGCGPIRSFILIALPLVRPGLIAAMLFIFLGAWKEFLFALTLCPNQSKWVISVAIQSFIGENSTSWNEMMAISILSIIPIVIIFLFLQKYLVSGMVSGAVKS